MSTISVSLPADGSTADVADFNTPINAIVNEFNGNIDNSNIKTGAAIDPSKLAGGSSAMLAAWASYTPVLTNITTGNGTLVASYVQIGKTVSAKGVFTMGSTSSVAGAIAIALPVTASSTAMSANGSIIGAGVAVDTGIFAYPLDAIYSSTTTMVLNARITVSGTNPVYQDVNSNREISNTVPITFATGDSFTWNVTYEAA